MKHSIRLFVIAGCLSVLLSAGVLLVKHPTAQACSTYQVAASVTTFYPETPANAPSNTLSLWYNSCTGQNFASMSNGADAMIYVHRLAGPDGGELTLSTNCQLNGGTCNSPNVYSPHNKAQACYVDVPSGGHFLLCTDFF